MFCNTTRPKEEINSSVIILSYQDVRYLSFHIIKSIYKVIFNTNVAIHDMNVFTFCLEEILWIFLHFEKGRFMFNVYKHIFNNIRYNWPFEA